MLRNTFLHIPGIGEKSEEKIWDAGAISWDSFKPPFSDNFLKGKNRIISMYLEESEKHLSGNNPNYFSDLLPSSHHWRMFPEFRNNIAYIDIETTGLEEYDKITTIALYDGEKIYWYVNGRNLEDFARDIFRYKLIVTFNGKTFDAPFIERFFDIKLNHSHIDLRYVLNSLEYSGGLKACEKKLGISRGDLSGIDGMFAIRLWNEYIRNDNERALDTLIAYNIEDVVNLEKLMIISYNKKILNTFFNTSNHIDPPSNVEIPFSPDKEIVEKIMQMYFY